MSRLGQGEATHVAAGTAGPTRPAGARAAGAPPARSPVSGDAAEPRWAARLAAGDARSLLEVAVLPGRLEVVEHYGDGAAARLAAELRRLGCDALLAFHSPCG